MPEQNLSLRGPLGPVLAFDTSGPFIMAGLAGGAGLPGVSLAMARGQAERLMPLLEEHLAAAGLGWRDLGGIGVGIGPGNFTGTRISVAAARGLALALGIPAVGVSQFDLQARGLTGRLLVALAAPQGRAYVQLREGGQALAAPMMADLDHPLEAPLPDGVTVIGHQAAALAAVNGCAAQDLPCWTTDTAEDWPNRLAALARARILAGPAPRPAPLYVRPPDAAPPSDPPPVILDA